MELLEDGEVLEARRERLGGKLPPEEVARVGDQVLDVMALAHEQGIVHRDIKPENIFLLNDGTLKVLDFGIAHIKEGVMKSGESTATGLLLGTPDFMSPEQAMGMRGTIDQQTDVYAVGATMFTLLSGEAVHTDQALGALLHSTSTKQARSLATTWVKDHVPQSLIAVIDKALMLHKPQRWPSARAMQEALHKAMPMTFKPAISQPPAEPQSKTRPLASIDQLTRGGSNVRTRGEGAAPPATPRDGVKAVAAKAPRAPSDSGPRSDRTALLESPRSEEVPTPRDPSSPWLAEFKGGTGEGPSRSPRAAYRTRADRATDAAAARCLGRTAPTIQARSGVAAGAAGRAVEQIFSQEPILSIPPTGPPTPAPSRPSIPGAADQRADVGYAGGCPACDRRRRRRAVVPPPATPVTAKSVSSTSPNMPSWPASGRRQRYGLDAAAVRARLESVSGLHAADAACTNRRRAATPCRPPAVVVGARRRAGIERSPASRSRSTAGTVDATLGTAAHLDGAAADPARVAVARHAGRCESSNPPARRKRREVDERSSWGGDHPRAARRHHALDRRVSAPQAGPRNRRPSGS